MSELKPCPFCGSTVYLLDVATQPSGIELWDVYCANHQCYLSGGTNNMYETRHLAIEAWNTRVDPPELATLREQVKVLRDALGWLVNEMDCRDDEFGGCLFTRQDFKIARDALEQTKPMEGER